jgi:hypothetical protein
MRNAILSFDAADQRFGGANTISGGGGLTNPQHFGSRHVTRSRRIRRYVPWIGALSWALAPLSIDLLDFSHLGC